MTWLWWALKLLLAAKVGMATTFWAHGDPGNPDNRNYCTNRVLRDHELVAAHPKLPCGTRVFVYAWRTGKSVVVRVQDRGPRHALLDLSRGAARAIGANGMEPVVMLPLPREELP